jgi:hypothetical protein
MIEFYTQSLAVVGISALSFQSGHGTRRTGLVVLLAASSQNNFALGKATELH